MTMPISYDRETNKLSTAVREWKTYSFESRPSGRQTFNSSPGGPGNFVNPKAHHYGHNTWAYPSGLQTREAVWYDYNRYVNSVSGVLNYTQIQHVPGVEQSSGAITAYNVALSKMYGKISGELNITVDAAEMSQTYRMLKSFVSIRSLLKDFLRVLEKDPVWKRRTRAEKRIDARINKYLKATGGSREADARALRNAAQRKLDYATEMWLGYRYGVRPLMASVEDAMTTLLGGHLLKQPHPVRGLGAWGTDLSKRDGTGSFASPFVTRTTRGTVNVEVKCRFLPRGPSVNDFASFSVLGLGYELLTLSFVLDWFWNWGMYFETLEKAESWRTSFVSGYVSTLEIVETAAVAEGRTPRTLQRYSDGTYVPSQTGSDYISWKAGLKTVRFTRSVLATAPMPRAPKFSVNLNAQRGLDAIALFHNFFVKKADRVGLPRSMYYSFK